MRIPLQLGTRDTGTIMKEGSCVRRGTDDSINRTCVSLSSWILGNSSVSVDLRHWDGTLGQLQIQATSGGYSWLSPWLHLEWATIQKWRAQLRENSLLFEVGGSTSSTDLWGRRTCLWFQSWGGKPKLLGQARRKPLLFACLVSPCEQIHSFTGYHFRIPAYTADQLRQAVSWTEKILDSWIFCS